MENDLKNVEKLIIEQRFKKFFLLLFGITAMKNAEISRDVKKKKKKKREITWKKIMRNVRYVFAL